MAHPKYPEKNSKSEAAKSFDEADNAGRFSGNDADAQAAKEQASENVRQDANSTRGERNSDDTDAEARRDPAQSHDYKGEAQNVNDDTGRPLSNDESRRASNKANEGKDRDVIL